MSQSDLFLTEDSRRVKQRDYQTFELDPGQLYFYNDFLNSQYSQDLFKVLQSEINWQQPSLNFAGQEHKIPRLQAWYGDNPYAYTYSGKTFVAESWHPEILKIRNEINEATGYTFNSALCNLYRDGKDSVAWHADDEPELGHLAIIASFSLGETRPFQLRKKADHQQTFKLPLNHNDLIIMGPGVQNHWQHQVPKTSKRVGPRINITFRKIIPSL